VRTTNNNERRRSEARLFFSFDSFFALKYAIQTRRKQNHKREEQKKRKTKILAAVEHSPRHTVKGRGGVGENQCPFSNNKNRITSHQNPYITRGKKIVEGAKERTKKNERGQKVVQQRW
jgi:hypothetical protein